MGATIYWQQISCRGSLNKKNCNKFPEKSPSKQQLFLITGPLKNANNLWFLEMHLEQGDKDQNRGKWAFCWKLFTSTLITLYNKCLFSVSVWNVRVYCSPLYLYGWVIGDHFNKGLINAHTVEIVYVYGNVLTAC